ncbi:MAG: methyltransferase domain-containing protein [Candidatus Manganitrophus sp.]|nr:MAG: methyltransferase domain-containing protein [Candidatus Manganitrophus sp.]
MQREVDKRYPAKMRYQDSAYAGHYDGARYQTRWAQFKNKQTHQTLMKALAFLEPGSTIIDLPCGTGRFGAFLSGLGFRWIGSDISAQMMAKSQEKVKGNDRVLGHIRSDAEVLPFRDKSVDCFLSIRFLPHLPPDVKQNALKEMARVSRQWLIIDHTYRNPYKAFWRNIGTKIGVGSGGKKRLTKEEVFQEIERAGLRIHRVFPVSRLFSDNMLLLCSKI